MPAARSQFLAVLQQQLRLPLNIHVDDGQCCHVDEPAHGARLVADVLERVGDFD